MAHGPTKEFTAAHEAGHTTIFLACGIPVQWVEVRTHNVTPTIRRFGYTETSENDWMIASSLQYEAKILRRILGKAGGLAGEMLAGMLDDAESYKGALDDIRQIGAGLVNLGLVPQGTVTAPTLYISAVVKEAAELLQKNAAFFNELRQSLVVNGRVEFPSLHHSWLPDDDRRFMSVLADIGGLSSPPAADPTARGAGGLLSGDLIGPPERPTRRDAS